MFLETTSLFSSFFFPIQFPSLSQQAFFFKDHDLSKLHVAECLPASRKANLRYFHNMLQGLSFPKTLPLKKLLMECRNNLIPGNPDV